MDDRAVDRDARTAAVPIKPDQESARFHGHALYLCIRFVLNGVDADDGELTRTNKVRRGFIADKYKPLVDGLYEGKAEQFIETVVKFEDGRTGSVSATLRIADARTFDPVKAAA